MGLFDSININASALTAEKTRIDVISKILQMLIQPGVLEDYPIEDS